MSSNEANIHWYAIQPRFFHTSLTRNAARKMEEFSYSQEARAFHLGIAQSIFPRTAEHLMAERRRLGPLLKSSGDIVLHLNARSGGQSQLEIDTMLMEDYDYVRIQGDCPAMEARADTIINEFRGKPNPNVILMDMHLGWCMERGIAILIEVTKSDGEWKVGRNVVRFQYVSRVYLSFAANSANRHLRKFRGKR
jgi:hypothetical protein